MNAVGKAGICSDLFYYVMELLTGERYAIGDIFIHNKYDWEIQDDVQVNKISMLFKVNHSDIYALKCNRLGVKESDLLLNAQNARKLPL